MQSGVVEEPATNVPPRKPNALALILALSLLTPSMVRVSVAKKATTPPRLPSQGSATMLLKALIVTVVYSGTTMTWVTRAL
ncbi:hypothetical protein BON30_21850 [Cystobacter ferrugineus]|uniref:Uncharacterized protein n=1 Tax=Cystobacter ferrugineus TaxID=83449 RepID=A0A1L9B9F6_9BACT|nr:hypothetical protein BON30_21850 [Cystobacter ferrugineus]